MAIGVRQVGEIRKRSGRLVRLCMVFASVACAYCDVGLAQDVQRIAAIVNDEIISIYDLENQIRLAVTTANLPPRQDVYRRLRPQVLRTMIDERLQLQEAASLKIRVKQREINRAISEPCAPESYENRSAVGATGQSPSGSLSARNSG